MGRPSSLRISTTHKTCGDCGENKPRSEFYRRKDAKYETHYSRCKACHGVLTSANPRKAALVKAWGLRNRARRNAAMKAWRLKNPERDKATAKRWRESHRDYVNGRKMRRILVAKQQTPAWANKFFMSEIRALARLRTRVMGYEWHVDHIVPLRHPLVCGLHWEGNMRVVPSKVNLQKNNRHWPDMP